jgi:ubiquinone/menaquinone biosynthesis C-methylase UbiE
MDKFFVLSKRLAQKHPAIVVFLMHDYFRNMYPDDPYIEERYAKDALTNILQSLENNIVILNAYAKMGSYFSNSHSLSVVKEKAQDDITRMSNLFGTLWQKRYNEKMLNSQKVIYDLFVANELDLKAIIKDKYVIDIGCGSGRFAIALAQMGSRKVIAVDINNQGLKIAKKSARDLGISNIEFIEHNVLDLPFKDETFDFVFSKGVLHHTGNLKKGVEEYSRVLKKGGSGFLYLYANGGIYWKSREKMREIMQLIPMEFTVEVLNYIGMPSRRTIFVDSWYVPVEDYVTSEFVETTFGDLGFNKIQRLKSHRSFELDKIVLENGDWAKDIWGEGELRYFLTK